MSIFLWPVVAIIEVWAHIDDKVPETLTKAFALAFVQSVSSAILLVKLEGDRCKCNYRLLHLEAEKLIWWTRFRL